ncbi:MAG TPA: ATP-binding protein [Polyangiaceae bacterium]|nr:ATP-binding protein [Polyangiaceae bacterium]
MASTAPSTEPLANSDDGLGSAPWIVELTIAQAVRRAERAFAGVRVGFCSLVLCLFLFTQPHGSPDFAGRLLMEAAVFALGVGFSLWMTSRTARGPLGESALLASVTVDALLCLVGLGSNLFARDFPGLLAGPDVAIVPLVVITSIFRVSWRAAWTSSAACTLGLAALLALETRLGLQHAIEPLLLLFVYLLAATGVALFGVRRARQMFERVGQTARRAERARSSVLSLLEDHHDLRSILCDLQLQAERLVEKTAERSSSVGSSVGNPTGTNAEPLLRVVAELSRASGRTRDRAVEALAGMERPEPGRLREALTAASEQLRSRHPEIELSVDAPEAERRVPFPGGTEGLERLLLQLLINAAEGDGARGARAIVIRLLRSPTGLIELAIDDDGPGFSDALLGSAGRERGTSSKHGSAGLGLWLCRGALRTVGGELSVGNLQQGGARVRLSLPVLAPSSSSGRPGRP